MVYHEAAAGGLGGEAARGWCSMAALPPGSTHRARARRNRRQTKNGAVASAVLVHLTRGTGPLGLALAGATRSGSAGVGSHGSRYGEELMPHSRGMNWKDN